MTVVTRKPNKSLRRVTRKPTAPSRKRRVEVLNSQQMYRRIDELIRELQGLLRQITPFAPAVPPNVVDQLFGALGHGTWEEYDLALDWKRFGEWNLR